jgi:hypothetical protein
MKSFQSVVVALLCLLSFAAAHASAGPNMKPGLWEQTVKMEMPGMPQAMPEQKSQRCVTPKDLEDPRRVGPGADPRTAGQCEVSNFRMQGNTATWDMACKGEQQMKGSGSMTYQGDRYSGVNRMTMNQGGQTMTMTMNYSGRYLGDCKPGSK